MAWELIDNIRGPKGDKGDTGTVASVSVATLPAGSAAKVTKTGTTDVHVHFDIPQGAKGEQGVPGTLSSADAESVPAGESASVIMSGTTEVKHAHFKIPRGLPGVNAIENDTAVAAYVDAEDSDTRAALGGYLATAVAINVRTFGARGDGGTDDTQAIQAAIDYAYSQGGGKVYLPDGSYKVSASILAETFSNDGAEVAANTGCLILRPKVSLIGTGMSRCKISANDPTLTLIFVPAAHSSAIEGMEIANSWEAGINGAGHGIFTLSASTTAINDTVGCLFRDLYIHSVGGYGVGIQAGNPRDNVLDSILVEDCGADGLDLKARHSMSTRSGNFASNITVRNHGQRVTGSGGMDIRGVWHLSNIVVTDFGGNAALSYGGIRFRTKPSGAELDTVEGANSTLTGFYIEAAEGASSAERNGVESGSDDVHISNGTVKNCTTGVLLTGNSTGSALRNSVMNVVSVNASAYGFRTVTGVDAAMFIGCTSVASVTAGFRNEGTSTTLMACQSISEATAVSTSSGAAASEIRQGNRFGNEYGITLQSPAAGRVSVAARGASTDIDVSLEPKGAGLVRFGNYTAGSDAAVVGYVTIKDSAGAARKLAVIS